MCTVLRADPKAITFDSLDAAPRFSNEETEASLKKAAASLQANQVAAFPTETVVSVF